MASYSGIRNFVKNVCKGAVLIIPPWIAFNDIGWTVRSVDGVSMEPTLNPGGNNEDFVLLNRWSADINSIGKGDIVSLVSPKNPNQWLIKRVIALEGDQVKAHSCFEEKVVVPKGHCWVEGDNLDHSFDSNHFGPVSMGLITAKASRVLWPPKRWGELAGKDVPSDRVIENYNLTLGKHFFGWPETGENGETDEADEAEGAEGEVSEVKMEVLED